MPARLISCFIPLIVAFAMAFDPSAHATGASDAVRADRTTARVDEVALRYYVSRRQNDRVDAEIRRLQKLHPGWQPPSDLWTQPSGGSDDAQLWDLFAANKLDELHAAIALRRAKDANWKPSVDLALKLRRKELRPRILSGARAQRWNDLAAIATTWQSDVAPDDLESLWLVAEAFAKSGRTSEAAQVLQTAMKGAASPNDRLATVQKAFTLSLSIKSIEQLIAVGKANGAGHNEFDAVAIDLTRARISALLHNLPGDDIAATDLATFQDFAKSSVDPGQAALLGWYSLKQSKADDALSYFKSAIAKGGDATVAQGLVITLRKLGRLRDAEEIAFAWREPLPANMTLFIDIVADQLARRDPIEIKRLTRYADATLQTASGDGAEALGWYAFGTCQTEAASEWFKRAVAWHPKETAVFGYALALQRLHRDADIVQIVNRYDGLFPSAVGLMFPDGADKAGDPCQPSSPQKGGSTMVASQGEVPQARGTMTKWKQSAAPAIPMPGQFASSTPDMTAVARGAFPVAVDPANPLRFQSSGRASPTKAIATAWRPADPSMRIVDARRVPGVGEMPYERLGRTLLPGVAGLQQPSSAPSRILQAPQGTLWAAEQNAATTSQTSTTEPPAGQFTGISTVASSAANDRFHR